MNSDSNSIVTQNTHWTRDQINLIKQTVAKNATDNELQLFMHNAKRLGLDPFARQIHFVKYGNSAGSIIVGIDGFRAVASRTGQLSGIKRGVIKDARGVLVGGWAEVYRKDWDHPAREEVSFAEYTTGKNNWLKMPETMIKKVAEVAALRMAFPSDLSGVYAPEEMHDDDRPKKTKEIKAEVKKGKKAEGEPEPEPEIDMRMVLLKEIQDQANGLGINAADLKWCINETFGLKSAKEMNLKELRELLDAITSGSVQDWIFQKSIDKQETEMEGDVP